jgi:hypothetical protein
MRAICDQHRGDAQAGNALQEPLVFARTQSNFLFQRERIQGSFYIDGLVFDFVSYVNLPSQQNFTSLVDHTTQRLQEEISFLQQNLQIL